MGACGAGQRTAEAGQTTGVNPAARQCAQAAPPVDAVDAVASRLDIRTLQAELGGFSGPGANGT